MKVSTEHKHKVFASMRRWRSCSELTVPRKYTGSINILLKVLPEKARLAITAGKNFSLFFCVPTAKPFVNRSFAGSLCHGYRCSAEDQTYRISLIKYEIYLHWIGVAVWPECIGSALFNCFFQHMQTSETVKHSFRNLF